MNRPGWVQHNIKHNCHFDSNLQAVSLVYGSGFEPSIFQCEWTVKQLKTYVTQSYNKSDEKTSLIPKRKKEYDAKKTQNGDMIN
jgi:hypothetical protein